MSRRGDEADKRSQKRRLSVVFCVVGNQDDLVGGIVGQLVRAVISARVDVRHQRLARQVEHLHRAVFAGRHAIARPELASSSVVILAKEFVSLVDDGYAVGAGGAACWLSSGKYTHAQGVKEGIALGIEDVDAAGAAVCQVIPAALRIHPTDVETGEGWWVNGFDQSIVCGLLIIICGSCG